MREHVVCGSHTVYRTLGSAVFALGLLLQAAVCVAAWCGDQFIPSMPSECDPHDGCGGPPDGGHGGGGGGGGAVRSGGTSSLPGGAGCIPPGAGCRKSPNYVATGAYATTAADLGIRTIGFPLLASRTYYSGRAMDGPMGLGWSPSVVSRLYYAVYLFSAPSTYQKVASVITPGGSRWTFVDNGNGTFTPPLGRHDTLVHNGDGTWDLTIERTISKLHFDSGGALTSLKDDYGNTLNLTYDGNGRVQQIADAAGSGRYLNVGWGADGRISTITDNTARQVQYGYTGATLTTVRDAANRVTTYGYTTIRFGPLLTQIKDNWNRVITDVTYDTQGRTQTYTEKGETWTYTYAWQSNPSQTLKTDSAGNQWLFTYDSNGLVTDTVPPPFASPTHVLYYADESVQQLTDGVGIKTHYTYAPQGGVQTVTRDYQGTQALRFDYVYDPAFPGRVTSVTPKDPATGLPNLDWQGWKYEFYQAGSSAPGALFKVKRVENDGTTLDTLATYVYNSKGQVTQYTGAKTGGVTDYAYDAQGNLRTATLPPNNDGGTRPVITYRYDPLGRVTSVTEALSHQTTYLYDNVDRVLKVTLPKPTPTSPLNFVTTYSYDNYDSGTGLTFTNVTDPNLLITKQGYDQFGQLARTVDAQNGVTSYGYVKGLLTSITDANNNVTSYGYEPSRRLTQAVFPDNTTENYHYWGDDLLYQKGNRNGATVSFFYDNLKRLSWEQEGSGIHVLDYSYQGQKIVQTAAYNDSAMFGYDSSYRLTTNTEDTRGTINYLYTSAADDTVANYSVQSGPSSTYTYYPDGSLNTIVWSPVSGQFKYRYTLSGQYQSVTFPSGATRNYTYDDQGRLTNLTNLKSGGTNLATYAYGYDHNYTTGLDTMLGQRTAMTGTIPAIPWTNKLTTYEYDSSYELKKATYPSGTPFNGEVHSWTYDAIGNRLTSTVNSTTTTYTYQKIGANPLNWQRLLNDGTSAYTYDNNGNSQTIGTPTLLWDLFDRLNLVLNPSLSYGYDYQGRRDKKTVSGTSTTYLYDGLNLIQEKTGSTTTDYLFGPGIDEPLAESVSGTVYNFGVDGLGSVTLTTLAGSSQNTYVYDAWGKGRYQIGSNPNPPFGYTARENGELGTMFYRARYYLPSIGRFLSEDPTQYRADFNLYRYVANGPVQLFDPTGLAIKQCFRAFTGPMGLLTPLILISPPIPGNTMCPMHEFLYNTDTGEFRDYDPQRSRNWETDVNVICWTIDEPLGRCVWNAMPDTGPGTGPYRLLSHNCQSVIEDAKEQCGKKKCMGIGAKFPRCGGFGCLDNR